MSDEKQTTSISIAGSMYIFKHEKVNEKVISEIEISFVYYIEVNT